MNYLVVIDPDHDRRRAYIESWRADIAPVPGLLVGNLDAGACSMLWAVGPKTPVHAVQNEGGCEVTFGMAHDDGKPIRTTELRREGPASVPPALDGLHVCIISDGRALRVSGDVFGILPVYFGAFSGGAIVASSPELFKGHPATNDAVITACTATTASAGRPCASSPRKPFLRPLPSSIRRLCARSWDERARGSTSKI